MTRIAAVRSAFPPYRYKQAELTAAIAEISALEPARQVLLERLHGNAGVETRNTVLPLAEYSALGGMGPTNDLYIERATALGRKLSATRSRPLAWPPARWTCSSSPRLPASPCRRWTPG
jgi:predicted naringenin-chalcone synthase